jgi:hypothetical protein
VDLIYEFSSRQIKVINQMSQQNYDLPLKTTPTDYSQSMNSREAIRNRLIKYLVPVILLSETFNIPKFLEAKLVYRQAEPMIEVNASNPDPSWNISVPTSASTPESNSTPRWIPMVRS